MMLKTVSRHVSFCPWVFFTCKLVWHPICYGRMINGLMPKDNIVCQCIVISLEVLLTLTFHSYSDLEIFSCAVILTLITLDLKNGKDLALVKSNIP